MSIDDEGELAWIKKTVISGQWSVDSGQRAVPVLPLWEGDKIFLRLLLDDGTPFFSLKLVYENDEMTSATLNGKGVRVRS